ncbi:MAG: T9SS type A sorting domain-containing protein [Chlorobi bacterium]|nr:T9SS type A sorting domain-containing protein [Chlorobiota bacterium]
MAQALTLVILSFFLFPYVSWGQRILPRHIEYLGAFRLPAGSGGSNWEYSGHAMTYYPYGDPNGPNDGFPGSIFGIGHAWHMQVSEISIPRPVISPTKNINDLPTARTLREFTDVRSGIGSLNVLQEIVRVGMEYLPAQGAQTTGKLYFAWGAHFQEDEQNVASHMWCETDLSNCRGAWWVGSRSLYSVNDYMFEIPADWASRHVQGMRLATGRYRDGGWSGQGPALYAIAPWSDGNPPPPNARLANIQLLQYSTSFYEDTTDYKMDDYHHSDEWTGGAWLTAAGSSAIIFAGTKGIGDSAWYGNENGPCLECPNRGWWSSAFQGRFIFYDPADLVKVAEGRMKPYEPQPYAVMNIDPYLYHIDSSQQKYHTGALSYDRERNILYMFEPFVDEDRSIVHAWKIHIPQTGESGLPSSERFILDQNFPNPVKNRTTIRFSIPYQDAVALSIYNTLGREVLRVFNRRNVDPGRHRVSVDMTNLPNGVYFYSLRTSRQATRRMMILKH